MDEAFNDCLVGAGGGQGVHGGEVWSHQGRPETDGEVLTGHQVLFVALTHPGKHKGSRNNWMDSLLIFRTIKIYTDNFL